MAKNIVDGFLSFISKTASTHTSPSTSANLVLIVLAAVMAAGALVLLAVLASRNVKNAELAKAAEESERKRKELELLNAKLKLQSAEPRAAPRSVEPAPDEGLVPAQGEAEARNKELIFLTKDYLVSDFIDVVSRRFPDGFEMRARKVELDAREEKRLADIVRQLEKIEGLAPRYEYRFPLDYYYHKARYHLGCRDFAGLLALLRGATEQFLREDTLHIALTRLLTMMARHAEAAACCERFLSFRPAHPETLRLLVRNLMGLKEYKKAEEECRKLIDLTAAPADRGLLGYILNCEGYISRSEELFEELAKSGAADEWSLYAALIEEERGLCSEALPKAQKAWSRDNTNYEAAKAFIRLNNIFGHTNQNRKVMETVRFNSDLDPEVILLYLQDNPAEHAELMIYRDLLQRICRERGSDNRAWACLGTYLLRTDRPDEAEKALQTAMAGDEPVPLLARLSLARLLLERKAFDRAKPLIDSLVEADPSGIEARSLLAEYYGAAGNADEATAIIRALADSGARNIHLFDCLGRLFLRQKDWKESLYYFNLVEEQDAKNTSLFKNIAFAYFNLADYENAVRYYGRILELNSTNIDALNNLGVIHSIRKEYKRARKHFQRALQIDPDSKQTNFNMALLYKRINQESSARHYAKYKDLIRQQVNDGPVA